MPLVTITDNFAEALHKDGVVPDVLSDFSQKGLVMAAFGGHEVAMGNTLLPKDTQKRPDVQLTFLETQPGDSYTLVMTDPDAPRRGDKKWSEFAHFIASGIKPGVKEGEPHPVDFSKAKILLPYMGPAPPEKTGKHRYVLALFKESGEVSGIPEDKRANWGTGKPGSGIREWAEKQGLTPVAINFFLAENDVQ